VGIVLDNFRTVAEGVKKIVEPTTLARLKNNVKALNNRALFEIPEILAGLMLEPRQQKDRQSVLAEQI
jgi:1,2-diacylglycerol 3-beta-galactosyltransferase